MLPPSLTPRQHDPCLRSSSLALLLLLVQIRTLAVQAMNLVIVLRPTQLTVSMEGFIQVAKQWWLSCRDDAVLVITFRDG